MACPAGPLERCGAVAYTTDQENYPLPPNNQSHSTEERVRDENVKLPHMVMVMCLFFNMWQGLADPNHFLLLLLIFALFLRVSCGGGRALVRQRKKCDP